MAVALAAAGGIPVQGRPGRCRSRPPRVLVSVVVAALAVAACAPTVASPSPVGASGTGVPSTEPGAAGASATPRYAAASMPPVDPDALEPGLGWAKVYEVERPEEAFALPSEPPTGPVGPGTAGHPGHFPGQAIVADVAVTPGGLVAVGLSVALSRRRNIPAEPGPTSA